MSHKGWPQEASIILLKTNLKNEKNERGRATPNPRWAAAIKRIVIDALIVNNQMVFSFHGKKRA